MRKLLLITILFAAPVEAIECPPEIKSPCKDLSFYALAVGGCPEFTPGANTSVPLCRQGAVSQFSYLDKRCYKPAAFDWQKPCYEWDCAVPYGTTYVEPRSGCYYTEAASAEEIDQHYRSVRQHLGQILRKKGKR